jgi:hypothetical protein
MEHQKPFGKRCHPKLQSAMEYQKLLGKASSKAQSAMEYLMTYGWAILVIAVVLGTLYSLGIFNPSNFAPKAQPGSCQVFRPSGPGTSYDANLEGECSGELPQYIAIFTGSNYVLDSSPNMPTSPPISITAWVYPMQSQGGGIVGWGGTGCGGDTYALVQAANYLLFAGAGCPGISSSMSMTPDRWHFVAVSMGVANELFFMDGSTSSNTVVPNSIPQVTFTIGTYNYGVNNGIGSAFTGYISNVQVYNITLSQNSLSTIYLEGIGGAPVDPQHLVGWWPLNGNANDYSGNNNNGVSSNVVFTGSWTRGYTPP